MNENFNLSEEFEITGETDEEMEAEFEAFIAALKEDSPECWTRTSIMNFDVLKRINFAYGAMKRSVAGKGVTVSYKLNQPYESMGSVSVVGREVSITNPGLFLCASRLASNLEVYPKTDGTVKMTLTFHNLTIEVGE